MTESTEEIYNAVHRVMASVGYVQKERNRNLDYTFASEKAFIEALRPAMVEQKLSVHCTHIQELRRDQYTTKHGSQMTNTTALFTFRFAHPSGGHFDACAIGEGADVGDKSANKAMTAALKYVLRQTFLIETGDDPDSESSQEKEPAPKRMWTGTDLKAELDRKAITMLDLSPVLGETVTKDNFAALIDAWMAAGPNRNLRTLVDEAAEKGLAHAVAQ